MALSTEAKKYFLSRDFASIRSLFQKEGVEVFSDLDDTLSLSSAIFFSKYFLLTRVLRKDPVKAARFLLRDFVINPGFLKVAREHSIHKFFILSRNDQRFVDAFISETRKLFAKHGMEILGGLGSDKYLLKGRMHTADKIEMLPNWALLISDVFEAEKLKHYKKFVSVDREPSSFIVLARTFVKLLRLGWFLVSLIWLVWSI